MSVQQPLLFGGTPIVGVTWNPADEGGLGSITLTNGNLTATGSGAKGVRGTTSHTTGKYYFEILIGSMTSANDAPAIGVARAALTLGSAVVWGNADGACCYPATAAGGGLVTFSNLNQLSHVFAVADIYGICADLTNGVFYVLVNNTLLGGQNPAAGTGGLQAITTGTAYFPCVQGNSAWGVTASFASSAWTYAAPSGYSQW